MDKGDQKVSTSSYKMKKYKGCNVQHDDCSNTAVWYTGKLLRINTKSSQHKKKLFSCSFPSLFLFYLYEMIDVKWWGNCFATYVN